MNIHLNTIQETLDQHHITEACEGFTQRSSAALSHCATSDFAWTVLSGFAAGALAGGAGRLFAKGVLRTGLNVLGSSCEVRQFEKVALRQLFRVGAFNHLALRLAAGFSSYFVNASVFNRLMGHAGGINNLRTTADFMLMHPGSVLAGSLLSRVSPLPLSIVGDFLLGGLNFCVSSGTRAALENLVHHTEDTFAAHVSLEQLVEGGAMHLGNRVAEVSLGRVAEFGLERIQ